VKGDYDYDELELWVINNEVLWTRYQDYHERDDYDEVAMCKFIEDYRDEISREIDCARGVY
jgi:hypothetical protein